MRQPLSRLASVASAAVILAVGLAPLGVQAADHLDSPTVSGSGATDLTDVYAFAVGGNRSVFIANVNPGAGALPNSTIYFGSSVQYNLTVDTNGDARPDVTYLLRFGRVSGGQQTVTIWRNGVLWGVGHHQPQHLARWRRQPVGRPRGRPVLLRPRRVQGQHSRRRQRPNAVRRQEGQLLQGPQRVVDRPDGSGLDDRWQRQDDRHQRQHRRLQGRQLAPGRPDGPSRLQHRLQQPSRHGRRKRQLRQGAVQPDDPGRADAASASRPT